MTENPINTTEIASMLRDGRISDTLASLSNAAGGLRQLAVYGSEIERLRSQYGYMADFAMSGRPDPSLDESMKELKASILALADAMSRTVIATDTPTLYYSLVRTAPAMPRKHLVEVVDRYFQLNQKLQLASLAENPTEASASLNMRAEACERALFNHIWTTYPLSPSDAEAYRSLLDSPSLPDHVKALAVSAMTLGVMEWHDELRLHLLMDGYDSDNTAVSMRSLCGLLMAMWQWRDRPMSRKLTNRFDVLSELPSWPSDVRMANMQFIRARDTERLTRKFNDELLPEMMKLRPEIERLNRSKPLDMDSPFPEENPEWAELLEKSGLADRLKEMQEIQEEGGDVMMATFSRLKTFPFFNEPAHWFIPFHSDRSELQTDADSGIAALVDIIVNSPMFCDSDKYSVALSLSSMLPAQRDMLTSQLSLQADQFEQIRAAGLNKSSDTAEQILINYVRNLYRFYKLFRRKSEFRDPFASGMNLPALPALSHIFDDLDTLRLIGEFYFRRRYYADAFQVFSRVDRLTTPEAELYQKMGYCQQALGNLNEAIRFYEQSEMLNPHSRWTRRRLASCHTAAGNHESALHYLKMLAEGKPDDASLSLETGLCLVKLRRFDEALGELFKAEYLGADSPKALRAIAWCTLLGGDYERCRTFTDRVLSLPDPTPRDHLNAGYLDLLTGSPSQAAGHWANSIAARDFDMAAFRADLTRDAAAIPALKAINPITIAIVADRSSQMASDKGHRI
ncbi:MAG: tetratricopeptide repeat protein [Muribaculaceae bacterium]|nr:tetratricopeptide repeat protein [Muribaculaceae bacterium]